MKVYLVGGAVRDKLLNLPIQEKDWVVVGATKEELLALGYNQVGSDFPVFLHPKTKEEYALARTERKSGQGYYGFICDFNAEVTIEEDLSRRDLTINAMAMDDKGNLIDPFNGLEDLKNKVLRHVSDAFVEDPVRVLRVARFAARFHHKGFRLANETRQLMYAMVKNKELDNLIPERVWQEWQRSLEEKNPEVFIETLRACGALEVILPELHALFGVPNSSHYHPEVDSGIHTLMVLQAAVKLTKDPKVRFAALVHDLGKAKTPVKNWPKHHGHEEAGVKIIEKLCQRLRIPTDYRNLSVLVSRMHLNIHRLFELKHSTAVKILEQCDAFRKPQQFEALLLACEADAKGVLTKEEEEYPQGKMWLDIYDFCAKIDAKSLIEKGLEGKAIKEALHALRVEGLKTISRA